MLPIFSYDANKYPNVYHPIDSPESTSDTYLLKESEFSFIRHDSVLKLNDIRTVSVNRILYRHEGRIMPESETYVRIEKLILQKYFAEFYHEYECDKKQILRFQQELESLEEQNKTLLEEKKWMQEKIELLENKTEKMKTCG